MKKKKQKKTTQNGELWSVIGNQAQAQECAVKNSLENRRFKLAHSEKRILIETQILIVMSLSRRGPAASTNIVLLSLCRESELWL